MIDFSLTSEQKALQKAAREFSQEILKPLVRAADAEPDPQKGFQMIKPAYEKAYEMGFATGFLPKKYGGGGLSNVDVLIVPTLCEDATNPTGTVALMLTVAEPS